MGLIIPSAPIDKTMKYTVYIVKDLLENKVVYVGKTQNFNRRKQEHLGLRANTKDWISAIGTNNVEITPIEYFETKEEALKREDELIIRYDTINNGYNKQRSGLIKVGREKEYQKEYREKNREEYNEYQKEYNKQYHEKNREKWNEYQKQYNQDHREKYNEYQKEYKRDLRASKKLGMTVSEYRERSLI